MDGVANTRDDVISSANQNSREAEMLESCIGLLKDELDSLKRKESNRCNMKIVSCKVADVKGEVNNLVDGLR